MTYETIGFDVRDGVAWITINRPASFNALNLTAMRELFDVAHHCKTVREIRCAVLTGSGDKAFCAGGDVAGFFEAGDAVDRLLQEMTGFLHMAISHFASMRAPLIAAVNGVAAGAGLSLVSFCDLAIASGNARFTSAYTQIGLTPDGSSTWYLSRILGHRRATELYLTNRTLSAQEALDWGLINRVVPAADLQSEVGALAVQLANGPTLAYGGVKRLLQAAPNDSLESQMARETETIIEAATSADGREGVRAFIEHRKPTFTAT